MTPILLTLTLVLLSNIIAIPLGVAWGWALDSLGQPHSTKSSFRDTARRFFSDAMLACLIGMLSIPLYIHAAGWEGAAGKFGWFPTLQGGPRFWFSGIWAAAWIHGTYGACWVAIATWWALRRQPRSVDYCARLDASLPSRKWLIDIPLASGWIVAAGAWNSVLVATEMTVADLYGVSTLADTVYKIYALDPQPLPVLVATLLPALLVVPFLIWLLNHSEWLTWTLRGDDEWSGNSDGAPIEPANVDQEQHSDQSRLSHLAPTLAALSITALVGLVPALSLVAKAGWTVSHTEDTQASTNYGQENTEATVVRSRLTHSFQWRQVWDTVRTSTGSFQSELAWTAQLAFSTIVCALPICLLLAAFAESNAAIRGPLLILMLLMAMIPGPVISLLVIQVFNLPSLGLLYDRTLIPSVVALLPRALPAGYLILRAGYRMLDQAVLDCAKLDGLGKDWLGTIRRLCSIDAPRLWRPVTLTAVCILLIACGDLSATLLVLPPSVSTVASRLFGLLHSGVRHQEAGLALIAAFWIGIVSVPMIRLVR